VEPSPTWSAHCPGAAWWSASGALDVVVGPVLGIRPRRRLLYREVGLNRPGALTEGIHQLWVHTVLVHQVRDAEFPSVDQ
jgi:hypothetical protein